MRLQDSQANCGAASLSNALAALGISHSQAECAELCKTTATEGTPPKRLLSGAKQLGRQPQVVSEKRGAVAMLYLDAHLRAGRPAVLCVDNDEHWVAAVGLLGERILVADPADNELVLSYSRAGLVARWGSKAGRYYGIVL
jgi:ABC-type bacteriocin/lantibiotic exporter with double-glycine peptidase domain